MPKNLLREKELFIFWMAIQSFQLLEEKKSTTNQFNPFDVINGPFGEMKATGKYNLLIQANVSENQVGLSLNDSSRFLITWELIREENFDGTDYMIFSGWGDPMNGGHRQFEGHKIGLEKKMFIELFTGQVKSSPDYYSKDKLLNIIGFEKISFNF